ncbi:MAG: spore cortex biosynthesis protein YabQ, partial [Oscillospiraceae bacterium]
MASAQQAWALCGGVLLGGLLGVCYDVCRALRRRLPLLGTVLDFLFFFTLTAALLAYSLAATGGYQRIYVAAALLCGAALYFLFLSRYVAAFFGLLVEGVAQLLHILAIPMVLAGRLFKKVAKNAKKHFLFLWEWSRISLMRKEMGETLSQGQGWQEGWTADEDEK